MSWITLFLAVEAVMLVLVVLFFMGASDQPNSTLTKPYPEKVGREEQAPDKPEKPEKIDRAA